MKPKKEPVARIDLKGLEIDGIIKVMNARYGLNTLIRASEAAGMVLNFMSTGVYALDFALGGGIPRNRIVEIRGPFSSLKTTLVYSTAISFLQMYPDGIVLIVDMERSLDPNYAASIGLDPEHFIIAVPDSGEQAVNIIADMLGTDKEMFIGVDSVAAMIPTAEVEASADQQSMGLQARLINKMMRIITARMKRSMYDTSQPGATVIFLNQLREKIGVVFGNPETSPGGKGKDFAYSMIVRVSSSPGDAIKREVTVNDITRTIRYGQNVKFSVLKNKCGSSQFEDGEFEFYVKPWEGKPAYSFNNAETLFRYAAFYDVIEQRSDKKGNFYYYSDDLQGKMPSMFIKKIEADDSLESEIYEKVIAAIVKEESDKGTDEAPEVEAVTAEESEDEEPVAPKKKTFKVKIGK